VDQYIDCCRAVGLETRAAAPGISGVRLFVDEDGRSHPSLSGWLTQRITADAHGDSCDADFSHAPLNTVALDDRAHIQVGLVAETFDLRTVLVEHLCRHRAAVPSRGRTVFLGSSLRVGGAFRQISIQAAHEKIVDPFPSSAKR
jgi:hypothetical protein